MKATRPDPTCRPPLDEPPGGGLMLDYGPDEEAVAENPPRFRWLPEFDAAARYRIQVEAVGGTGTVYEFCAIAGNFFTPDAPLPPGEYRWRYAQCGGADAAPRSEWSRARRFRLAEGLPEAPAMRRDGRWDAAPSIHPRLWLDDEGVARFRQALAEDAQHCGWPDFMQRAVVPWLAREPVAEPPPYPGHQRQVEAWRKSYIACQEALYAIRHLSVAARVSGDAAILAQARAWLLAVAAWDPRGTTSRAYNDEAAFRVAQALAWGYDWLHDALSADERAQVAVVLAQRAEEIAHHVVAHARIHLFPLDSHAVRALSSVLLPCGIALLGEHTAAQDWLDYAVDYFDGLFPPWGGAAGGWAEGPHYWNTGMAAFLEAAVLLRDFCGHDLFRRPFLQRTGDFILAVRAPDTRRSAFGDDSTLGQPPSLKLAKNMRLLAGMTGQGLYQWHAEQVEALHPEIPTGYADYGWWDFAWDDLLCRAHCAPLAAGDPATLPRLHHFADVGWVAVQQRLGEPREHLQLVAKASDYGSISHSNADQGAFTLFAYGEDLAIHSGHYVAHNSSMHRDWRRQTRSKNALLINGKGQYAGDDKRLAREAGGRVLEVMETPQAIRIALDATAAYRHTAPELLRWRRDIHFVHGRYVVLVDQVELAESGRVQWLLHSPWRLVAQGQAFRGEGARAGLTGEHVFSAAGPLALDVVEGFPGVAEAELAGLARHFHVSSETPPALRHQLVTVLVPYRIGERERVFHFIDDQGFATHLYFQDGGGGLYRVSLDKLF